MKKFVIADQEGKVLPGAFDTAEEARLEAEQAVNAKYPDMDGCYSAAAWKPVSEFAPQVGESVALPNAKENYEEH